VSVLIELRPDAGPALVVGGGNVALRKVRNLVEGEFRISVIAPQVLPRIREQAWTTIVNRAFEPADIDATPPWALVFACTNDRDVNREIGRLARLRNIPVVVADSQRESTFFTPATIRDGDLAVAVSTGGASPALAKAIRERIVTALGPGWAGVVATARRERQQRRAQGETAPK
jgi:siroheme synthase-like protein